MLVSLKKLGNFNELAEEVKSYLYKDDIHKTIGLSGGTTIPPLMEAIGQSTFLSEKNHWTWIDERLVPHSDEGSNYGVLKNLLLKSLCFPLPCTNDIQERNIYQKTLAVHQGLPQLDLLLLGFGGDGHIASLFPGTPQLSLECTATDWVFRSQAAYEPKERWTWGMEALTRSKKTFIIFKGENDSEKFHRFYEANNDEKCDSPLAIFMRQNKNSMEAFQVIS